ncbi:MAG: sporulation protein YtfJ [Clostridia bacterium]|nr:sporulation protein YtfJ [Clostridia bacterium]
MQTQISEIVESAISNLTKVAEVNTIIGKPIVTYDGSTILPISQITFAFMAGGGEYGNKNLARSFAKNNLDANFAGGSGGGATMKPIGFLVIGKNGVEMITTEGDSTLEKIIDIAKDFADPSN